jgi:chromosome segregation ATPase
MTNQQQSPEDFLHALIETYDLAPANEPFTIHLDQINRLCAAEAVLRDRKDEIGDLNRMLDQANEKLEKLEKRYTELAQQYQHSVVDLKVARNELLDVQHNTETHEVIRERLTASEYALKVAICTVPTEDSQFHDDIINRAFVDLRGWLTYADDDIPF